jgi:hypothetical protein
MEDANCKVRSRTVSWVRIHWPPCATVGGGQSGFAARLSRGDVEKIKKGASTIKAA